MLQWCANGFGAIALQSLQSHNTARAVTPEQDSPWAPKPSHFQAKAKNVIFLYMDGGPSHVDTFDYKPALEKYNGKNPHEVIGNLAPTQFDAVGSVLKSPWEFKQQGESGHWISSPI